VTFVGLSCKAADIVRPSARCNRLAGAPRAHNLPVSYRIPHDLVSRLELQSHHEQRQMREVSESSARGGYCFLATYLDGDPVELQLTG